MAHELTDERPVFVSTMPIGVRDRRLAMTVVAICGFAFLVTLPFVQIQLARIWAFIPAYQSVLIINDIVTAALLFGQYRILRTPGLLALACGYSYTACITFAHMLTYPFVFAETGGLGAGPQTTAWLYMFWHGGFPIFVIAYAFLARDSRGAASVRPARAIVTSVISVIVVAIAITAFATLGHSLLPAVMTPDHHYTPTLTVVVWIVWSLSMIALLTLWWRRRPLTVLDMWLMVVMFAWLCDIALSAVLNAGRFDLGFYAGRVYGLLAASFVFFVLLYEFGLMYYRLVDLHESEQRKARQLEAANQELEAFSYSVSHDLRAPLRSIDGFSVALIEDCAEQLDAQGKDYLQRVRNGCQRMGQLIDDLLALSRVISHQMRWEDVDLSASANAAIAQLRQGEPDRQVEIVIQDRIRVRGDQGLLRIVLDNLLGNAWKFTRKTANARIELYVLQNNGETVFCVRDNGAGFNMAYAGKLFRAFQRLHDASVFPGTGIGLATVHRIISRHGGRIWAESEAEKGAAFYFTLKEAK